MTKLVTVALAAGMMLAITSPAAARDGCGPGEHRGPHGHCRPDRGPGPVIVAPGLIIGGFYPHRGYWDGRRYWQRRYRDHNGWRYR